MTADVRRAWPLRRFLFAATFVVCLLAGASAGRADTTAGLLDELDRSAPTTVAADAVGAAEPIRTSSALLWFFAPTLVTAAAIGVCGATLGTFVLRRGEAMLAFTLPQAVAIGAAVGMRLGVPELPPAMIAVAIALVIFARERRVSFGRPRGPSLVPAMYVAALCGSFLVIAHGGRHVEELQNLFTGIDVAVSPGQAGAVAPPLLASAAFVALLWRRWLLLAQSPVAAELAGVSVGRWNGLFLVCLSAYVLLGTATQGVVMVLAMLLLPPTIVGPWARRLPGAIAAASIVSLVMLATAFVASNAWAWPLSHSVGGIGAGLLLASRVFPAGRAERR